MNKILKGFLIFDLVLVNAGVGYLIYQFSIFNFQSISKNTISQLSNTPQIQNIDVCGEECQKQIEQRTMVLDRRIAGLEEKEGITPVPTLRPSSGLVPKTKVRTTQYVTIPGSGSSSGNNWQDLTGTDFYFDPADYPGLAEVYFEASMKLFNGNGMAYVRLFDVTHGIGVQGSEVSTNSQAETVVVSGQVSFWAGRNLIRVQAKSLTADTTIYSYGRLKVVTEN
jgi:hypothetical protein